MLAFPAGLRPVSGGFAPAMKTLGGGQALSGYEQVVSTFNDRWQAAFTFSISKSADVLALRAFVLAMRGRSGSVLLPASDGGRAPWRTDPYGRLVTPKLARNPALDGTAFADPAGLVDGLIEASLASDAAAQSTSVSVAVAAGGAPQAGHLFSIGTQLYSALSVTGNGPYNIEIGPWLRLAAASGAAVNFTSPACEMRFASDTEGADVLKALNLLRFGTVTLNFDEVAR